LARETAGDHAKAIRQRHGRYVTGRTRNISRVLGVTGECQEESMPVADVYKGVSIAVASAVRCQTDLMGSQFEYSRYVVRASYGYVQRRHGRA
jgi:hypothetical protein